MAEDSDAAAARAAAGARRAVLNDREKRSFVPILVVGVAILSGILLFFSEEDRSGPSPATSPATQSQANPPPPAALNN